MAIPRTNGRAAPHAPDRYLALTEKGAPVGAELEHAIAAVEAVAAAVHAAKRATGHEFHLGAAELRLRAPKPGARGGASWAVLVRVPGFVTDRDAAAAAEHAAAHRPIARKVRLELMEPAGEKVAARPGRDRLPSTIRETRSGAVSQHRGRELR